MPAQTICKFHKDHKKLYAFNNVNNSIFSAIKGKHYENAPIQIYRKSHPQKLKIFR